MSAMTSSGYEGPSVRYADPAVGTYRFHRGAWRRWSGRSWAPATYSAHPERLKKSREWLTYPELTEARRQRLLEIAIDIEVLDRGTVVNRSAAGVTMAYQRPVSHVRHAVITLLTGGVWAIVWLCMCLNRRSDRVRYEVDPWGNIWPVVLA